jgi:hypothetical protein
LGEGIVDETAAMFQITPRDQFALGMSWQPAFPMAKEFLHLVVSHPIVLVAIEHRDEHIKMAEQGMHRLRAGEFDAMIDAFSPLGKEPVERRGGGAYGVAERLKKTAQQFRAPSAWKRGNRRVQRKRHVNEFRPFLGAPGEGRVKNPRDGHAEKR